MISANNIAELLNYIKKHKKIGNLRLNIKGKDIKITKSKKPDLVLQNDKIIFNIKISKILRQCCEIIIPLLTKNDNFLIGQIGQSLDGKIALNNGNSHYINEKESILYLHCLRAVCDGVLVGVNTVIKDNPLLTTRKIKGSSPVRLIIDPSLKLSNKYKIFKDNNQNIIFTNSNKQKRSTSLKTSWKLKYTIDSVTEYNLHSLYTFSLALVGGWLALVRTSRHVLSLPRSIVLFALHSLGSLLIPPA